MSGKGHCEKASGPSGPGGTKGGPPWPDTRARARPKERRAAAACQPSAGAPPAGHRCCRSRRTLGAGGSVSRGPETTPSPGARAGRVRAGGGGGGGEGGRHPNLFTCTCTWQTRRSEEEVTCSRTLSKPVDAGLPVVLPPLQSPPPPPHSYPAFRSPEGLSFPPSAGPALIPPLLPSPVPPHQPTSSRNRPALQLQKSPCSEALLPPGAAGLNGFQFRARRCQPVGMILRTTGEASSFWILHSSTQLFRTQRCLVQGQTRTR